MGQVVTDQLKQEIWGRIETTLDGYSDMIERLLRCMTEEQLRDILQSQRDGGTCEDCGTACEHNVDACLCCTCKGPSLNQAANQEHLVVDGQTEDDREDAAQCDCVQVAGPTEQRCVSLENECHHTYGCSNGHEVQEHRNEGQYR